MTVLGENKLQLIQPHTGGAPPTPIQAVYSVLGGKVQRGSPCAQQLLRKAWLTLRRGSLLTAPHRRFSVQGPINCLGSRSTAHLSGKLRENNYLKPACWHSNSKYWCSFFKPTKRKEFNSRYCSISKREQQALELQGKGEIRSREPQTSLEHTGRTLCLPQLFRLIS